MNVWFFHASLANNYATILSKAPLLENLATVRIKIEFLGIYSVL